MEEWLKRFLRATTEDVTLTLNGTTIKRSDCFELARGSEKRVYKIKDQNLCFFIPHKWSSEDSWNSLIKKEKTLLDEIHELGLKTQRFEITSLEIHEPGKPSYSILVLVTKNLESLCQEEAMAIFNPKGTQGKVNTRIIGNVPNFFSQQKKFEDPIFVRKMFEKIINEYAIALTFNLPIGILDSCDDSVHYCFELSSDSEEASMARFMFWDVVLDFKGVQPPFVPTLSFLKSAGRAENSGLRFLANQIACAMYSMSIQEWDVEDDFVSVTQKNLLVAINDNDFLNQALAHARKVSANFLNTVLNSIQKGLQEIDTPYFERLMKSAISTSDLKLVEQFFQLPNAKALPKPINTLLEFAEQYENQPIIDYLKNQKRLESSVQLVPIGNAERSTDKSDNPYNEHMFFEQPRSQSGIKPLGKSEPAFVAATMS